MTYRKLHPPLIEDKIIAQCSTEYLTIPFQMNKSVGINEFDNLVMTIQTIRSNSSQKTLKCPKEHIFYQNGMYWAKFIIENLSLLIGQHYRIQLAYENQAGVGFFSTVATFKFTSRPKVSIQDLDENNINNHIYTYTGYFENDQDFSEKVYSYQFNLYNNNNQLVATSGELLHNSSNDTENYCSTDVWTTKYSLDLDSNYTLIYTVKTVNGLEISSKSYVIQNRQATPSTLFRYCSFSAENNFDSACIDLYLRPIPGAKRKMQSGKFIILRGSSEDNFDCWHELTRFTLVSQDPSQVKLICKDYCVKQGVKYKYCIQEYGETGVYSKREESELITVDFEDMFLSDGKRQLRIQFNPKVSSIKNTILESKMDTLGGTYPFFFRNGNVKYKEFPISGLISMLMDKNEEFLKGIQFLSLKRSSTPAEKTDYSELPNSLTTEVFEKERTFKMEVLEWLNNGKPKLFRSPAEGNFIVRLMNCSLSPNDTLGRMLHTFSSTAYEIDECNFENLRKYNIMVEDSLEFRDLIYYSDSMDDIETKGVLKGLNACRMKVVAAPDTTFYYYLKDNEIKHYCTIGDTGVYTFSNSVLENTPLEEIGHDRGSYGWPSGSTITYAQYGKYTTNHYSYISSTTVKDKTIQIAGQNRAEIPVLLDDTYQILKTMGITYYLSIQKRPIEEVAAAKKISGDIYTFMTEEGSVYEPMKIEILYCDGNYYDGGTGKRIDGAPEYSVQLRKNDNKINMDKIQFNFNSAAIADCDSAEVIDGRLIITKIVNLDHLYLGSGLYVDMTYQEINISYTLEETNENIKRLKEIWLNSDSKINYLNYYNALYAALEPS